MLEKIQLLLLIVTANGVPILLDDLLGRRWAWPLDAGLRFADGRRLLGHSATIRGLVGAMIATTGVALALGFPAQTGVMVGLFAMVGYLPARSRCTVISGGQLKRTGRMQEPAPVEV